MKMNSSFPGRTRCDVDLRPFWTRAIWFLFPLALVLVCAARRNDSHPPSTPAGQSLDPEPAGAVARGVQLRGELARRSAATAREQASPAPDSENLSAQPADSSPQPIAPSPLTSAATALIPLPETVHNMPPVKNEPPGPPAESETSAPLSTPPDDEGIDQPHLGQAPPEIPPAFEAPVGTPGNDAPPNDDSVIPVAPGFPEPGSPFLRAAPNADAGESDLDRTWSMSIALALRDTNAAHLVVEEARLDRIPDAAWPSILAALLGQPAPDGAQRAIDLSVSASLTAEDLLARIDLAEQLALVVPKAATREALEQVCLSLVRRFKSHFS